MNNKKPINTGNKNIKILVTDNKIKQKKWNNQKK